SELARPWRYVPRIIGLEMSGELESFAVQILIGNHSRKQISCKGKNTISCIFLIHRVQDVVGSKL
ncbi:MAG: hypothetical protein WBM69_00885, partial [Desulfobacterales bacterium]